jgi:hypothetical protein
MHKILKSIYLKTIINEWIVFYLNPKPKYYISQTITHKYPSITSPKISWIYQNYQHDHNDTISLHSIQIS